MTCRMYLAALHYNENSTRRTAVCADGTSQHRIHFPKSKKGEYTVRSVKTKPTFDYTRGLLKLLLQKFQENPQELRAESADMRNNIPQPLASAFEHPDKNLAVARHIQRFN